MKNLRPITLLNVDYKLLEKVIAARLLPSLKTIIAEDQRGFLPDRRISVNIRKMLDVMSDLEARDEPGVIISCNFQKAFDRINLNSLQEAMKIFNFSDTLIEWTRTIYTGFKVKVQNNGFMSDDIEIQQGLHQGGA